jgi:glutaminase
MLNRSADVRTCVLADYDISGVSSRRSRQPHEKQLLDEHHREVRILELVGALNFATIDYVTRRLAHREAAAPLLILDFRRVPDITAAGGRLLGEFLGHLGNSGTTVIIAGQDPQSPLSRHLQPYLAGQQKLRQFPLLDDAIEWAEDQVIYRRGGFTEVRDPVHLVEQALLVGLTEEQIAALEALATTHRYGVGHKILSAGDKADSLYFLQSGMVSIKLPSGVRLATLGPGMQFGEMAMLEPTRSADVFADTAVTCLELPVEALTNFNTLNPQIALIILRNLSTILARRLVLANAKVDLLSAY